LSCQHLNNVYYRKVPRVGLFIVGASDFKIVKKGKGVFQRWVILLQKYKTFCFQQVVLWIFFNKKMQKFDSAW